MVEIGINENVYLDKVTLSPKNALEITFGEVAKAEAKKMDPFELLTAETVVETEADRAIRIFPPTPPKPDNDRTEEKNVDMLINDINGTKAILTHILRGYLTADEVKGQLQPFVGLPIDKDNFRSQILKKEILEGAHLNMCKQFLQMITPFLGRTDMPFRLLLVRQSADKAFPTFRKKYLEESPFWESMDIKRSDKIEENQSKVKFTKYELDNNLDSSAPVSKDAKATTGGNAAPAAAPMTAKNVFG